MASCLSFDRQPGGSLLIRALIGGPRWHHQSITLIIRHLQSLALRRVIVMDVMEPIAIWVPSGSKLTQQQNKPSCLSFNVDAMAGTQSSAARSSRGKRLLYFSINLHHGSKITQQSNEVKMKVHKAQFKTTIDSDMIRWLKICGDHIRNANEENYMAHNMSVLTGQSNRSQKMA